MAGHKIISKFYPFSLIPFTKDLAITSNGKMARVVVIVSRPNKLIFHIKLVLLLYTTFIRFKGKRLHM
jgi:hypothetical protein